MVREDLNEEVNGIFKSLEVLLEGVLVFFGQLFRRGLLRSGVLVEQGLMV